VRRDKHLALCHVLDVLRKTFFRLIETDSALNNALNAAINYHPLYSSSSAEDSQGATLPHPCTKVKSPNFLAMKNQLHWINVAAWFF
jgi:hypothetical protein